ncbi:MAG: TolC family protein [Gemmatimonadota bacterium]
MSCFLSVSRNAGRRTAPLVLCTLLLLGMPLSAQVTDSSGARSLSLDEALHLAVPASEALGIAEAGVLRARGVQTQARSQLFPQLNGSASYIRTLKSQFSALSSTSSDTFPAPVNCSRFVPNPGNPVPVRLDSLEHAVDCLANTNPLSAFGNLPFGRKNQFTLGLSFSQTLFAGGRIRGQLSSASAGRKSAEIGLTAAQAQLTLDVTRSYYDALLADRLLAIAQATLDQSDTTLAQTRLARQVGTQPEFELLRAQVTRDNLRPVAIQRRTARDIAYVRLKQLLNLPISQPLALTTTLGDSLPAAPVANPDTALEHRAPVRQASEAVRAQQGLRTAARGERLPTVALTSSFARLAYPNSGLPGWSDFVSDWTVTLGVQVPLFTGGRLTGDNQVAEANLRESKFRLEQTRKLAELDGQDAAAQLEAAQAAFLASQGTVEQANRAYQIAEIRYREGISTQTELNDSRIQAQQAQANRAQAARDLEVARVRQALLPDLPLAGATAQPGASGTSATPTTSSTPTVRQATQAGGLTTQPTGQTGNGTP